MDAKRRLFIAIFTRKSVGRPGERRSSCGRKFFDGVQPCGLEAGEANKMFQIKRGIVEHITPLLFNLRCRRIGFLFFLLVLWVFLSLVFF
jgi:hypothetical protein